MHGKKCLDKIIPNIYGVWHVDRTWKDDIRMHVYSVTQQKHIYHFLRMLLMETNIPRFRKFGLKHSAEKLLVHLLSI